MTSAERSGAEAAYLFRHAVLRDAAYSLQLPAQRRALHLQAYQVLEGMTARAPALAPLGLTMPSVDLSHPAVASAFDIAGHLRAAQAEPATRLTYLRLAAEHAGAGFDFASARERWLEFADLCPPNVRPFALYRAGLAAQRGGRLHQAAAILEQAVAAARNLGETVCEAACLVVQGRTLASMGRTAEAEAATWRSLELSRRAGDKQRESGALMVLASIHLVARRDREAEEHFAAAVAITRESGDRRGECAARTNRAAALLQLGMFADAAAELELGLKIATEIDDRDLRLGAMMSLAALRGASNNASEATARYEEAIILARQQGDRVSEAVGTNNAADVHHRAGNLPQARQLFSQALQLARETGHQQLELHTLICLAEVSFDAGNPDDSLGFARDAVPLARAVDSPAHMGMALAWRAVGEIASGQFGAAKGDWKEAAGILGKIGFSDQGVATAMVRACARAGVPPLGEDAS